VETIKFRLPAITSNARVFYGVWGVRLVSLLVWLIGGINLLSALSATWMNRLEPIKSILPLDFQAGNRLSTALAGLALVWLAGSLWRHKRTAWLLTMFLLFFSTLPGLFKEPGPATGLSIFLLLLLLSLGYGFYGQSDAPAVFLGLSILALTFLLALLSGMTGFLLEGLSAHPPVGLAAAIQQTLSMLATFYNPGFHPAGSFSWVYAGSIYLAGMAALGSALVMLDRPVVLRHLVTAQEREQVAQIVEKYGASIVAPLALVDDKQYFFSQGGSVIAYGVRGRGALALGDPIGPVMDRAAAISAFKAFCAWNDWQPSFIFTPCDSQADYRANGLQGLCIAYEARVPLDSFSLEGHDHKDVRYHFNRISRLGYRARFYAPPLEDEFIRQLQAVSDDWLSTHYGGEKYFLVGYFNDEYIRNSPVMAVHAPDGQVVAFANLIFTEHNRVITGDLVRGRTNMENGTMEFLTVSMMNWAISQCYDTFSLSAVTAVARGMEPDDPPIAKIVRSIAVPINHLYKFSGIYRFKEKFHPCWEPQYLVYPGTTALIPTLLTMLRLYSEKKSVRRVF